MSDTPSGSPEPPRALPGPSDASAQPPWADMAMAGSPEDGQQVNMRRLFAAMVRHKWLIVLMTVLGTAAGFVATRVVPAQYQAQATLWVQGQEGVSAGSQQQSGPIQSGQLLQWSSWVDLLQSFAVLDQVVRSQRLYLTVKDPADTALFDSFQLQPRFAPGAYRLRVSPDGRGVSLSTGDRVIQQAAPGDSLGSVVGFDWLPAKGELKPGRDVRFTVTTPREAAVTLKNQLQTIVPPQGSFMSLQLAGPNPAQTAATLNAVADRFVEVAAQLKREKLSELSKILDQQLTSSYTALGNAERALETFRVHTITLPSEQASPVTPGLQQTQNPVFQSFFEMRINRDQLARDRQNILSALVQPDSQVAEMQLEAIPSVRQSSELSAALTQLASDEAEARAMRVQFGDAYPPLRQKQAEIADLRRRAVPDLAHKLVADLSARISDMDARINSASAQLQAIPARAIEEARLERDVTIAENLYTTLQQRYEEARLAEVSSIPDVRVLDRAVTPDKPMNNRAIMLLLGGVLGGVGGAVVLVMLLDRMDRRVRYPDQISTGLGLATLGVVPRLRNGTRRLGAESEAQVVEALRSIRLNLQHAYGAAGPIVITITSPGGGDGKSFLSSNLAVSFADAGYRTLVIDGDIRRGVLHQVFGLQRKPGLLDHLVGKASREEIIQATQIKGVDFIGGGARRNTGPELLASARMSQLLISLRPAYGVIILDCAPLGAGVDPLVLGTLTGNVVLVLRVGVTDREFTKTKLDDMSRLPIRVLGAVLNDVKPGAGYEYYYHYSYLPGYGTSDEDGEEKVMAKRLPAGRE